MNNCEIKSPPVFSQEIPKWDRNTYADGNAMGAVVEQLFNNTVYNKEELKEKVDTEGGDISETQVSVLDESTEAFPVPMSGDKAKGLWGKLKKWQQDCLAKFGNYVLTSMITNQHVNSTSNIPSSALVYLMQQGVTQLNRDLADAKSNIQRRYPLDLLYPFSAACQFDSNGECPITLTRPLAHDFLLFLVAGTLDISLKNSTVQSTIEQNRCATALAGHRAAILFNGKLSEEIIMM
ncbi:MAG: hypothetical protein HFG43_13880 [Lachnospiraceae bacterium]|nr:hypothetical protein [Lachnospiraceae bacterium]